jgi:hypothetical protein
MNINLQDIIKNNTSKLIELIKKQNYFGCNVVSKDLTVTFLITRTKEGVFISEFLEYLFDNISEESEDEKMNEKMKNDIIDFLKKIEKINIFDRKELEKLIPDMIEIRYKVTSYQKEIWEKKPERTKSFKGLIE